MIFQVALPMIIGPLIGKLIVNNMSNKSYIDETTKEVLKLPPNYIWLFAALALLFVFIPTIILIAKENKINKIKNKGILYDQNK